MACLKKGQRVNRKALKAERYTLPELQDEAGGEVPHVWLRVLTGKEVKERIADRPAIGAAKPGDKPPATDYDLLALCVLNDDREPIFADAADVEVNFEVAASTQIEMVQKIIDLSGIQVDRRPN